MNDSVKHGIGLEDGYDGVYLTRVHGKMPFILTAHTRRREPKRG